MFVYSQDKSRLYPSAGKDETEYSDILPPGVYEFGLEMNLFSQRPYFELAPYKRNLVELKGAPFTDISRRVMSFANKKTLEVYNDFGVKHFQGCLLYGPPGTGKTCFIEWMTLELVKKHNAVAIRVDDIQKVGHIIKLARKNPETIVVIMLEELDRLLNSQYGSTQEFLLLCDGYKTPDNVIVFATTNHYSELPLALTQRPSRFGICELIDTIPPEIVTELIKELTPEKYVQSNKVNFQELSFKISEKKIKIDHIKHILLNVYAHNMSIDQSIKVTLQKQKEEEQGS